MEENYGMETQADCDKVIGMFDEGHPIRKIAEGRKEAIGREAEVAKVKEDFEKGIAKMLGKLPHPDGVHNIYVRWGEVDVPDGEPEEVMVNGEPQMRTPSHKESQWIVQVNHAVKVGNSPTATTTARKLAITVFKRNGTQLELIGNFASGQACCDYLKIPTGGDDSKRVLTREGFIHEPYAGTDYS